jgi:hypothetical protein
LTEVHFDYLKRDQVNALSNIYFGVSAKLDYDPEIATSQIIDIAMKARLCGGIQHFKSELRRISDK